MTAARRKPVDSGLLQDLAAEQHLEVTASADLKVAQVRRERDALKRLLVKADDRVLELEALMDRYTTIKPVDVKVPTWLAPKKTKTRAHVGTPVLMLSDLHLDEVVDLHEMDGINEYNREIAHKRLERVIEGAVKVSNTYVAGISFDGIVVPILGDIITGEIHTELALTNEAPVPATIAHWVPHLVSALKYLADEFGQVFVPCVDGNHDRRYIKIPAKKRAESSNAWIIYSWMADLCRDDKRITFGLTTSPEQIINVYDTNFLLTHGDGFRSSGGIGGIYPSMLKFLLKKYQMYAVAGRRIDWTLMGHWHQLIWGQNFTVNSSLKGFDEYAKSGGFGLERPSQGLFIVTPENGITNRMAIFAD